MQAPGDGESTAVVPRSTLAPAGVAVAAYTTPGIYDGRSIVYRVGDASYGAYEYREWAIPLGDMLGMLTESVLQRDPPAGGMVLFDPPGRRNFTYEWRGTVREFEEVDRGKSVYAAVRLDVQLVRTANDSVIWTGSRRDERPVPGATMPAIVRVLSEIAADQLRALTQDAKRALSTIARSDTTARP